MRRDTFQTVALCAFLLGVSCSMPLVILVASSVDVMAVTCLLCWCCDCKHLAAEKMTLLGKSCTMCCLSYLFRRVIVAMSCFPLFVHKASISSTPNSASGTLSNEIQTCILPERRPPGGFDSVMALKILKPFNPKCL